MAKPVTQQARAVYEKLTEDHDRDHGPESLGIPIFSHSYSWKDALAIISCALSLAVGQPSLSSNPESLSTWARLDSSYVSAYA